MNGEKTTNDLSIALCDEGHPQFTESGWRDLKQLRKRVVIDENFNERTTAVEYRSYDSDNIIRRDVHVHLKKPMVFAEGLAANIG